MTTRISASAAYIAPSVVTTPKRRSSRGAAKTELTASSRPQPKNTSPSACAPISSGNGV